MKKTGLKCPECHRVLSDFGEKGCPRCEQLRRVIDKTSCRYLLQKKSIDFKDVKNLLGNWPLGVQQEFVRAIVAFKIKN